MVGVVVVIIIPTLWLGSISIIRVFWEECNFDKYFDTVCIQKVRRVSNYKVRLIPISSMKFGDTTTIADTQVVFEVTPAFSETRGVTYSAVDPVHMPGSIQMYRSTGARTFEVGAQLISRNAADALRNIRYLQTLRGWTMPYFGQTDTLTQQNRMVRDQNSAFGPEDANMTSLERIQSEGVQLRGAPPDVLYLYAYSTDTSTATGGRSAPTSNVNRVPVVMTNLVITYPDDVDYIPVDMTGTGKFEPFPVKMAVGVTLAETHSPREYERFDLAAFKAGTLANF